MQNYSCQLRSAKKQLYRLVSLSSIFHCNGHKLLVHCERWERHSETLPSILQHRTRSSLTAEAIRSLEGKGTMCTQARTSSHIKLVILAFSYSPPLGLIPHHQPPPSQRVDFKSFSGRFRVVLESILRATRKRLEIDRKTTANRLSGGWSWRMSRRGRAVAEKQHHYI